MTNIISFPGLGIGEFEIKEAAFPFLFGRDVMWYGIILTLGIIAGFSYALFRSKRENITSDDVLDYGIYCVISAIIGARLYYVLTSLDRFIGETVGETLYNIVAIWDGGIAIYGAIIAGAIAIIIVSKVKKIKVTSALDMISPGVMLGQIIGRWGNFVNAEAFGEATTLPWRMGIRNEYYPETIYVHPTFLYESLWNLIGFVIINAFYKKKRYNGQIFLMYITWYGFGRMLVEGLRTDSLMVGSFRISQVLGFACFIVGTALLIYFGVKYRNNKSDVERNEKTEETAVATESCTDNAAICETNAENTDSSKGE